MSQYLDGSVFVKDDCIMPSGYDPIFSGTGPRKHSFFSDLSCDFFCRRVI